MMKHKNIPHEFGAEALATAAYVRIRVTDRSLPRNTTPFQVWFGKPPDVSQLKVFGSRCWYKMNNPNLKALDNRAREAVMLGKAAKQKAYRF